MSIVYILQYSYIGYVVRKTVVVTTITLNTMYYFIKVLALFMAGEKEREKNGLNHDFIFFFSSILGFFFPEYPKKIVLPFDKRYVGTRKIVDHDLRPFEGV